MHLAHNPAPWPPSRTDDELSDAVRARLGELGGGDPAFSGRSVPGPAAGDVAGVRSLAAGALVVRPAGVPAIMAVLGLADWWKPAWLDRPLSHTLRDHAHPDTWSAEPVPVAP